MKYYSEILKKTFDSEKDCLKAEAEFRVKAAEEKKRKSELAEARKTRAKEVEDALKDVQKAKDKYNELLNKFCKDYGSFHFSWSSDDLTNHPSLFDLFNLF